MDDELSSWAFVLVSAGAVGVVAVGLASLLGWWATLVGGGLAFLAAAWGLYCYVLLAGPRDDS